MTVYVHRDTVTAVAGATTSIGLNIPGGLIRQVVIRANTATTVFRASLTDSSGFRFRDYGFHTGEISDPGPTQSLALAIAGSLAINITNASPNDTFAVVVRVQE